MDVTQEFSDFLEDTEDENGDVMDTPVAASQIMEVIDNLINAEEEQRPFNPGAYLENLQSSQATRTPFSSFQIQPNPKSQYYWTKNNCNYVNIDNNNNADANQNNILDNQNFQRQQSTNISLNIKNSTTLSITGNIIINDLTHNIITQENNNNNIFDEYVENSEMNMDHFHLDDELFAIHRVNQYIDTLNKLSMDDVPADKCLQVCQSLADDLLWIAKISSNLKKTRAQSALCKGGKLLSNYFDQFGFFSITNAGQLLKSLVCSILQQKFDSVLSQMELFDFLSDFIVGVENPDMRQCLFDHTILAMNELVKRLKISVNNNGSFVKYEESTSLYNGFSLLKQLITTSSKPNDQRKQISNFIQLKCIEECTKKLPFSSINFLAAKTLEMVREKYNDQEIEDMEL